MGSEEDYVETVLTCEGDFYDPEFHAQLEEFSLQLKQLLAEDSTQELVLKKVEPWNSVKVTFNIPKEAALRLKQLAEQGNQTLRNLGILSVQIDGDSSISLTIAGKNNETTELVFRTGPPAASHPNRLAAASASTSVFDAEEAGALGPSNVDSTRKNISQYLGAQGQAASAALLDIFGSNGPATEGPSVQVGAQSPSHAAFPSPQLPFSSPSRSPSYNAGVSGGPQVPSSSPHHFMGGGPGISRAPPSYPGHPPHFMAPHQAGFPSPGSQHSPASPKYPTPPPSVSNPNSPGVRHGTTINFPGQVPHHMQQQQQHMVNNMVRLMGNKDITSQSPLLVNLLQNDANAIGNLNNFAQHGRVPVLFDSGAPPPKKKRKARKTKDSKEGNGVGGRMDSEQMMVSTIPQQDRVPVSGEPAFAFPSPQHHRPQSATPPNSTSVHYTTNSGPNQMDTKSRLINPITGQLEVVDDDSNSSVARSDSASSCSMHTDNNVSLSQLQPQPNPLVALHQSKLFTPSVSGSHNPVTMSSPNVTSSELGIQAAGTRISQNSSVAPSLPSSVNSVDSRIHLPLSISSAVTPSPLSSPMFSPPASSSSHSPSHSIAGLLRRMSDSDNTQTCRENRTELSVSDRVTVSSISSPMVASLAGTSVSHTVPGSAPVQQYPSHPPRHPLHAHHAHLPAHLQQRHPFPSSVSGPQHASMAAGSSLSLLGQMVHSRLSVPSAMHASGPSLAPHGVACTASIVSMAQHQHLHSAQHLHAQHPHHPQQQQQLYASSLPHPHPSTVPSTFPAPPPPRLQLLPPTTSAAPSVPASTFAGQIPSQMDTPPSSTDTASNPSLDNQSPSSQTSPTVAAGTSTSLAPAGSTQSGASDPSRPLSQPAVMAEENPPTSSPVCTQPGSSDTGMIPPEAETVHKQPEEQGKEDIEKEGSVEAEQSEQAASSPVQNDEQDPVQLQQQAEEMMDHVPSDIPATVASPSSTLHSSPHVSLATSPDSRVSDLERLGHETPSGKDPDSKESSPTYGGSANPNGPTSLDSADSGVSMGHSEHKKDDGSAPNGTSVYGDNHCDEDTDMMDETPQTTAVHTEASPSHSQETKQSIPSLHHNDQQLQDNDVSQLKTGNMCTSSSQGLLPYQNSMITNHQSPSSDVDNHKSEESMENHNGPENSHDHDSANEDTLGNSKATPVHSTATQVMSKNITVAYAMASDQQPGRLLKQDIADMVLNTNPKKSSDDLPFLVRPPFSKQAVTVEGDNHQKSVTAGQPGFHSSVDQSLNWMGRSDLNPGGGKPGQVTSLLDLSKPKLNGGDSNLELMLWVGDKFPPGKLRSQNNNKPTTVHNKDTLLDIEQTIQTSRCEDTEGEAVACEDEKRNSEPIAESIPANNQSSHTDDELSTPPLSEEEEAEVACDVCSKDNATPTDASLTTTSADTTPSTSSSPSVPAPVTQSSTTPSAEDTRTEAVDPSAHTQSEPVVRAESSNQDSSTKSEVKESRTDSHNEDTVNSEKSAQDKHDVKCVEGDASEVADVTDASVMDTKLREEADRTEGDVKQMDTGLTSDKKDDGDENSDKSDSSEHLSEEHVEKSEDKTEQEPGVEKTANSPDDDSVNSDMDTAQAVNENVMPTPNTVSSPSKSETVAVCSDAHCDNSDNRNSSLPEEVVAVASSIQITSVSTMPSVTSSIISPSFTVSPTTARTTVMTVTTTTYSSSLSENGSNLMASSIAADTVSPVPSFRPQISMVATEAGPTVSVATVSTEVKQTILQPVLQHPSASVSSAVVQPVSHQSSMHNNQYTAVVNHQAALPVDTTVPASVPVSVLPGGNPPISPVVAESLERKQTSAVLPSVQPVPLPQVINVDTQNAQVKETAKDVKKEGSPSVTKQATTKVSPEPEDKGRRSRTQTPEPSHSDSAAEKAKAGGCGATKGISILKPLYDKEAFFDDELDVSQPAKTEPVVEETVVTEAMSVVDSVPVVKQVQKKAQSTVAQLLQNAEKRQNCATVNQPLQSTSTVNQAVVTTSNTLQIVQAPSANPTSTVSVTTTQSVCMPVVSSVPMVRAPVTLLNAMSKLQPPVLSSTTLGVQLPTVVRASIAVAVRNPAPAVPSQLRHTVQNLLAKPVISPDQQKVIVTTVSQQITPQVKVTSTTSSSTAAPVTSTPEQLAQTIIKVAQEREKAAEKAKTAKKPHVTNTVTSFATPINTAHLSNFVQKSLSTPVKVNAVSHHHPIMAPGFHLNLTESVQKVMKPIPSSDTTPPPSPKTSKTQASTSQAVISPVKHVKVPYSTVTPRGTSPVRLPETLVELTSVLDSKTVVTTSSKSVQQLNHALSPVTVLNRQKTPSPQPGISALNISSASTYHRAVSPGMSSNMIHTSPQRISPSLSRTPSPRANPQLSPSRSSNYHISPPRSVPSPHGEHRKTPSPASSSTQKIPTPPLLMRASPSKVNPNVVQLPSNPLPGDVLVPTTTVITLRPTGVTGLVGEHSYSAKPVLTNHPTNAGSAVVLEGSTTAEVLQPKQMEPVPKPKVLDLSSAVEVKKPEFGSKIHNVNASLVARAMAAQAKKDVAPATSAVTPSTSPVKVTVAASVPKPLQHVTRQVTSKAKAEPVTEAPKVTPPSDLPVETVTKSEPRLEEGSSPVHIIHPVSKTYSKATAKAPVTRNSVEREVTLTENTQVQDEPSITVKTEAVKTRAGSKRKASDSVAADESDGASKPAKMLRSSSEPTKEDEATASKGPARIGRRASRESTESRASSADSKMDKDIKLNLPSTRSRKKSLSECSDTSSIADEQTGSRTRRGGLRAPADRSESPAPRSSARLSTRSSARRRQAEDSASPTKQPPTPSPTPPPPPAADTNPPQPTTAAEKPATRQNRGKRKHPSDDGDVPEKKAKEDSDADTATKAKRSTSPVKTEEEKKKTAQKSKAQPKKKDDHQSQEVEKRGKSTEPVVPVTSEGTTGSTDSVDTDPTTTQATRRSTRSNKAVKDHGDMVATPSYKRRR